MDTGFFFILGIIAIIAGLLGLYRSKKRTETRPDKRKKEAYLEFIGAIICFIIFFQPSSNPLVYIILPLIAVIIFYISRWYDVFFD